MFAMGGEQEGDVWWRSVIAALVHLFGEGAREMAWLSHTVAPLPQLIPPNYAGNSLVLNTKRLNNAAPCGWSKGSGKKSSLFRVKYQRLLPVTKPDPPGECCTATTMTE